MRSWKGFSKFNLDFNKIRYTNQTMSDKPCVSVEATIEEVQKDSIAYVKGLLNWGEKDKVLAESSKMQLGNYRRLSVVGGRAVKLKNPQKLIRSGGFHIEYKKCLLEGSGLGSLRFNVIYYNYQDFVPFGN